MIEAQFIDNAIDVINSFHRDERKAQVKQLRNLAKRWVEEAADVLRLGAQGDPFFIQDKAREFGRAYLVEQYGEEAVKARELSA